MDSLSTLVPLRSDVPPCCLVRICPCLDVLEKPSVHVSVVGLLEVASNMLPILPFFDMEANLEQRRSPSLSVTDNIRASERKVYVPQ